MPGWAERKQWWRNLRGGAQVQVRLRGQDVKAVAEVLAGESTFDAAADGLTAYLQRFPPSARTHHVRRAADGTLNADDVRSAAAHTIVVRIRP